jgi:hypothetical protein
MYRTRPAPPLLLQVREVHRVGGGAQHDQVDPGHPEPRQQPIEVRFRTGGAWRQDAGAPGRCTAQRPEQLVLNPELGGSRDVELLRGRDAGMCRVEDSAAAVGERLQYLLERGAIRARRVVAERESDGREHLA